MVQLQRMQNNASSSDGTVMLVAFSKHKACPNSESQSAAATFLRLPLEVCQKLVLGAAMGPFTPPSMCGELLPIEHTLAADTQHMHEGQT